MNKEEKFKTQSGYEFPAISCEQTVSLREALYSKLFISQTHVSEAASYSMAMVARFALGLSADQANVCVLAQSSLSGVIALATLRHLVNSGSKSNLFIINGNSQYDEAFKKEIIILNAMGVEPILIEDEKVPKIKLDDLNKALSVSHNSILGLFDQNKNNERFSGLVEVLNESSTPIHCIDCPLGIDPDSGKPINSPLFASSTLSLGTVYNGLFNGSDYTGRHYLCDISITKEMYLSVGQDISPLFSEQPVVQIFPSKNNTEAE